MNTTTRPLKVIGFSVPVTYAERINAITRRERRTKRAIFEAMVDLYEETTRQQERMFDALITKAIAEVEEEKQTHPKLPEEILADVRDMAQTLAKRANALNLEITEAGDLLQKSV